MKTTLVLGAGGFIGHHLVRCPRDVRYSIPTITRWRSACRAR
jgi:nucleoside-diphosphate-sugar epimerase